MRANYLTKCMIQNVSSAFAYLHLSIRQGREDRLEIIPNCKTLSFHRAVSFKRDKCLKAEVSDYCKAHLMILRLKEKYYMQKNKENYFVNICYTAFLIVFII